jgi:hypothetical protein
MKKQNVITRRERLCRLLDLSPEALSFGHTVEIQGRGFVKIRGGGAILLYTPEEIRVSLNRRGDFVSVRGSRLSCAAYNRGALGVEGRIDEVSFGREEGKK